MGGLRLEDLIDIRYAHLALAISETPAVRDFDDDVPPIRRFGLMTERQSDCGDERRHNQPDDGFLPEH